MATRVMVFTSFADRSELAIYAGLARSGFDLDIVCDPDAAGFEAVTAAGACVERFRISGRTDFAAMRMVRRRIRELAPSIVYTPNNHTLQAATLASIGLDVRRIAYRGTMGHLSRLDPASWLTYLNPGLACTVCVSDAVRQYLASMGVPEHRLQTIHKGHDVAWYSSSTKPDLADFGIPPGSFVVGFSGNMRPVKGVDVLIKAASALPSPHNIHFLLVGEVRDDRINRLANAPDVKNILHLAGFRKDASALMGACQAFVMPSVAREGLPRAAIEAMSQEVAPVVSDVGGMPELVVNGESGLVVHARDHMALASAISALATDPALCGRLGKAAKKRIMTDFNITSTVSAYATLFNKATGRTK